MLSSSSLQWWSHDYFLNSVSFLLRFVFVAVICRRRVINIDILIVGTIHVVVAANSCVSLTRDYFSFVILYTALDRILLRLPHFYVWFCRFYYYTKTPMTVTLCRCCTRFWWLFIYVTLDFRMGDWPDYRPRTSVLHFSPPPSYPFTWKVLRTFLVRKSVTTLCQDSNLVITHELKRLRLSRLCLVAVAHWRAGWKVWFNRYRPLDDGLENSRVIVTFSSRLLFFFFFIVMTSNVSVWWSENPVASWQLENVGQILRFSMATLSKVWSVTWSTRVKVPCEKLSDIWYWNVATVCPRCFLPHCRPSPCLRLLFFLFFLWPIPDS